MQLPTLIILPTGAGTREISRYWVLGWNYAGIGLGYWPDNQLITAYSGITLAAASNNAIPTKVQH